MNTTILDDVICGRRAATVKLLRHKGAPIVFEINADIAYELVFMHEGKLKRRDSKKYLDFLNMNDVEKLDRALSQGVCRWEIVSYATEG